MSVDSYSIGEFSKITGLSVKTLRFYHEKGVLLPSRVDEATGYRYYDSTAVDRARVIAALRRLELSLEEVADILRQGDDDADLVSHLERQKARIAERMARQREITRALDEMIRSERAALHLLQSDRFQIEEKVIPAMLIASYRMRGKYSDCGQGFARVARAAGRQIAGKSFCLYHDAEYKDDDAEFETCFPIRKEFRADGISTRVLEQTTCLSLVHRGPYPQLGRSYERVLRHAKERNCAIQLPTREVYLKGPGLIFRGNPKNYLTEIQLPIT